MERFGTRIAHFALYHTKTDELEALRRSLFSPGSNALLNCEFSPVSVATMQTEQILRWGPIPRWVFTYANDEAQQQELQRLALTGAF